MESEKLGDRSTVVYINFIFHLIWRTFKPLKPSVHLANWHLELALETVKMR